MNKLKTDTDLLKQLGRKITMEAVETLKQGSRLWAPKVVFATPTHTGSLVHPGADYMPLNLWIRYARVALRHQKATAYAYAMVSPAEAPAMGMLSVFVGDSTGQVGLQRYYLPSDALAPFEPVLTLPGEGNSSWAGPELLAKPQPHDAEVEAGAAWFEKTFLKLVAGHE